MRGIGHSIPDTVAILRMEARGEISETKMTEPNQALEPTTLSVTVCAPSRTDRAS